MLYDVFICHASEDKEGFVRALADALQKEHVEVWYDEFSLTLGDSIRRTIDKGLRQSRFGVVVLSNAFFIKQWPQYELDGLIELAHQGNDKVLLPVWHNVTHGEVLAYSPPLAGLKAALSSSGLRNVVAEILNVIRPQGSPFIRARDKLIEWGITPPVITDEYWLDVVEASNRIPAYGATIPDESAWSRWSFPLPEKDGGPTERGDRLAWTAMQLRWSEAAESEKISPITPPDTVLRFIDVHPGLFETCSTFPVLAAEYAPQLTIPGFGGDLEQYFEEAYKKSYDENWALRHPTFGGSEPISIANNYFSGGIFGPMVSPYGHAEHLMWLLSSASAWLPDRIHKVLLEGMISWRAWLWTDGKSRSENPKDDDALIMAFERATSARKPFRWTDAVKRDVMNRINYAIQTLHLPETPEIIMQKFLTLNIPKKCIQSEQLRNKKLKTRKIERI